MKLSKIMFWNKKEKPACVRSAPIVPDAEIDIENLPIASIERRGDQTIVEFWPDGKWRAIRCTLEQHNGFVRRFRRKLHKVHVPSDANDEECGCYKCHEQRGDFTSIESAMTVGMIVCNECGNKRCPHATDHTLPCTGSNEPGQSGSRHP